MDENYEHKCLGLLGEEIRIRRKSQGLSQAKLAMMINSGQSYIYRVEKGKVRVGLDKLIRIAKALDVSVSDLISF